MSEMLAGAAELRIHFIAEVDLNYLRKKLCWKPTEASKPNSSYCCTKADSTPFFVVFLNISRGWAVFRHQLRGAFIYEVIDNQLGPIIDITDLWVT